jgi:uncharacterized protein YkwD
MEVLSTNIPSTPLPTADSAISSPQSGNDQTEVVTPTNVRPSGSDTLVDTLTPPVAPANTESPTASLEGECSFKTNRVLEIELANLITSKRAEEGLADLDEQAQLTEAARLHAEDMGCNGFFSHVSPTNGGVLDRVAAVGYQYLTIGEIIAGGEISPEKVLQEWLDSPIHREQILDTKYRQIGLGFVQVEEQGYTYYWTVLFGEPANE